MSTDERTGAGGENEIQHGLLKMVFLQDMQAMAADSGYEGDDLFGMRTETAEMRRRQTAMIGNEDISGWSQEMIFQRIRELNDELEESYKAFCDKRLAILSDIDRLYKAQGNWRYSF